MLSLTSVVLTTRAPWRRDAGGTAAEITQNFIVRNITGTAGEDYGKVLAKYWGTRRMHIHVTHREQLMLILGATNSALAPFTIDALCANYIALSTITQRLAKRHGLHASLFGIGLLVTQVSSRPSTARYPSQLSLSFYTVH